MSKKATTKGSAEAPMGRPVTFIQRVAAFNRWREQYNPLRNLTVARAVALLEAYPRGEMADLQWLYNFIEQADADLFTLVERRAAAIGEMDWEIKVTPEEKRRTGWDESLAQEQKAALQEAYDRLTNLEDGIEHLALASFRGFAHLEKVYGEDGMVERFEIGDQWNMVREGLYGPWKYNREAASTTFAALPEQDLIFGKNDERRGDFVYREVKRHINRLGLIKFLRTSLAEKDWTAFLEIYGIPSGVVIMPPNIPQGKESEYETAAGQIAEGGSGALPNGSDYKTNDQPRGVNPFKEYLQYLSEKLVLAGTHGLLTMLAQSGSGTLAGSAHMEVFKTLARYEARKINGVMQRDFDAQVLERKQDFEGKPKLAYFELCYQESQQVGEVVEQLSKLSVAGYRVSAEEATERTGWEIQEPDQTPAGVPSNRNDGQEGNTAEAQRAQREQSPIANRQTGDPTEAQSELEAEAERAFAQAQARALRPLRNRLEKILLMAPEERAGALETLRGDLPQLLKEMNARPETAAVLEQALNAAVVNGLDSTAHRPTRTKK